MSNEEPGWRCPKCATMLRPKGSTEKAAVTYRRRPGPGKPKWDAHCKECGAKAHA